MIELYLNNTKVDIDDKLKINITYQQTDLNNPAAKINSYSKTVNIPGTINNNNLFGHIFRFDTNIISNDSLLGVSFDPNKRIPFVILENGAIYESGYAQLDKITLNKGVIIYSLTLYGYLGQFFYNLKYDENGKEKTLYDLYFGIIDLFGNKLSKDDESNNILFEMNKDYVKQCWDIILGKANDRTIYEDTDDNDIRKLICPVPCYQGYYEDFQNDIALVYTEGLSNDSVAVKDIVVDNKYYKPSAKWSKIELDREVSNFEMNDLRSHYLPYSVRLQAIYDAIKNTDNNGGFIVNDDNVNDIEKKYIYEGYIMLNPFKWNDINVNNINTTIIPAWSSVGPSFNNPTSVSDKLDLSKYVNPNGTIYILPKITFDSAPSKLYTSSIIYPGYEEEKTETTLFGSRDRYFLYTKRNAIGYASQSLQYFWVEVYDKDDNLLGRSDVNIYGDKQFDENGNAYYLSNAYGQIGNIYFSGFIPSMVGTSDEAIKYFLDRNNMKLYSGALSDYEKQFYEGYLTDNPVTGIVINRTHLYDGYTILKEDNNSFVGNVFSMNVPLFKNASYMKVKTDAITTEVDLIADKNYQYYPYSNRFDYVNYRFTPGFKSFDYIVTDTNKEDVKFNYKDVEINVTENRYAIKSTPNEIIGLIEDNSQVYDGSVVTLEERHTVNKFSLFENTNSPYDYLISMAKLFNWKFELEPKTNTVNIYSFNKYYTNTVEDINDYVDKTTVEIKPTTAESKYYNISLETEESYCTEVWHKKNKSNYGEITLSTDYEFGDEPKNILEDCIFKSAIPYTEKSVYFNATDEVWPKSTLGKYANVSMWSALENKEESEKRYGKLRTVQGLSQNVEDQVSRLCLFNDDYESIDMNNTLIFFNVLNTVDASNYYLYDNILATEQLTDGNCYVSILREGLNPITDLDNNITSEPLSVLEFIPGFNTHFFDETTNTDYWGTLKAEPSITHSGYQYKNPTGIYDICWKSYLTDLYNKNNKVVTLKVHLSEQPREAMKRFYTFDNAVFVLNKIIDYNSNDYLVKCEFIQVQNVYNYIS